MKKFLLAIGVFVSAIGFAQTNIVSTNIIAEEVLLGDYDPSDYAASTIITDHETIIQGIDDQINADSLKAYLEVMSSFENRNTGADTLSPTTGIGAARTWAYNKFQEYSAANDNRLEVSYLKWDQSICSMSSHKNVFAVLPGTDIENHSVVLVEAHFDSRCEGSCDIDCEAHGMEDNGSGSALVLELCRIMSQYTYKNTIVFMLTVGEEQGLFGARAFAKYAEDNEMNLEAVYNNDVIGGVICGATSSGPSCPGLNDIDSTQVRLFSYGGFDSKWKQLSRFTKLQYKEELQPIVDVPMQLTIMSNEDRIGRGGDHIPFRQRGYPSMRFTSANEHGDAGVGAGYTDRQHTTTDVLGLDTSGDGVLDSFFVDFNYLGRNASINGTAIAVTALGPQACDFEVQTFKDPNPALRIIITEETDYANYRVALRTLTNDWDSVYTISGAIDTIYPPVADDYIVSVASMDENGLESLFSRELLLPDSELGLAEDLTPSKGLELLQNRPNPFDEATIIGVKVNQTIDYKEAFIVIHDMQGKLVEKLPIELSNQVSEVTYEHGYGKVGTFIYSLMVDGTKLASKTMIFAN